MNKSILTIGLVSSVLLLAQGNALADHDFNDRIELRQHKQSQRIERGFNKGTLTFQELSRLLRKQFKFERLSQDFLDDGFYNKRERKILHRKYDKLDGMIYRMKHNGRKIQRSDHRPAREVHRKHHLKTYRKDRS